LVVNHTNPGELEISWHTDRPAQSIVNFGTTTQLGSGSNHNTGLLEKHKVVLRNLVPDQTYYFQALNTDLNGHISSSGILTVTMPM
jgi:hypothetical protein